MSLNGTLVDEIITNLSTDVSGAGAWTFYKYEPVQHQGSGKNCAVWFAVETIDDEFNTAGSHDVVLELHIRFWEPSPEKASGLSVDITAARSVETIYEDVRDSIYAHQTAANHYQVWFRSGAMLLGGEADLAIRGFEMVVMARRVQAFA